MVARFVNHNRRMGWANRPEFTAHLCSGLRSIGWDHDRIDNFCKVFAVDAGGSGALPFAW